MYTEEQIKILRSEIKISLPVSDILAMQSMLISTVQESTRLVIENLSSEKGPTKVDQTRINAANEMTNAIKVIEEQVEAYIGKESLNSIRETVMAMHKKIAEQKMNNFMGQGGQA